MMLDFIHLFVSIETILGNFLQIPFMKIVKDTEKPKDCNICYQRLFPFTRLEQVLAVVEHSCPLLPENGR